MKLFSDVVAHGLALAVAIGILAMAVELKQDVKAQQLERQPRNQALKDSREERKELKNERKERRKERRERRKEKRDGKPELKVLG